MLLTVTLICGRGNIAPPPYTMDFSLSYLKFYSIQTVRQTSGYQIASSSRFYLLNVKSSHKSLSFPFSQCNSYIHTCMPYAITYKYIHAKPHTNIIICVRVCVQIELCTCARMRTHLPFLIQRLICARSVVAFYFHLTANGRAARHTTIAGQRRFCSGDLSFRTDKDNSDR